MRACVCVCDVYVYGRFRNYPNCDDYIFTDAQTDTVVWPLHIFKMRELQFYPEISADKRPSSTILSVSRWLSI